MKKKRNNGNSSGQRPRRNVLTKQQSSSAGLSWKEETDLQKALYASLNVKRRQRVTDEESNDVFKSVSDSNYYSRGRIHAQRKFALGSTPSSPIPTPIKSRHNLTAANAVDVLPVKRPKTEDFLTFLCLRGSTVLPTSMDYQNGNFKDEDRTSESRSVTPSLWEKSENSSMNGNDNCRSREESIQTSDLISVKKSVLQSPNKRSIQKENVTISTRSLRNSTLNHNVMFSLLSSLVLILIYEAECAKSSSLLPLVDTAGQSRSITTRLVQKAKTITDPKKTLNETVKENTSGISALKQKYKEKRMESLKIVGKRGRPPKNMSSAVLERRITRSCEANKSSNSIDKQSRLRQAKLKPSIIEYASSDSENYLYPLATDEEIHHANKKDNISGNDSHTKLVYNKSNVKKSAKPSSVEKLSISKLTKDSSKEISSKKLSISEISSKDSPANKSGKNTFSEKTKKEVKLLPVEEKPVRKVIPRPSRKSLRKQILEVAGSATPSSSSSSSSSDSETEMRMLRNSKHFSVKATTQTSLRSQLLKKRPEKDAHDNNKSAIKKKRKDKKRCKDKLGYNKAVKHSKKFSSSSCDSFKKRDKSSIVNNYSNNISTKAAEKQKSKSKSPLKRLEYWPSFKTPKNKRHIVNSNSSSSSSSDSEAEKRTSLQRRISPNTIDSIIEFSSSDDSLYQELLMITKQGSKELSPKVSSLDITPGLTNKSFQNVKIGPSKARKSLSSEAKSYFDKGLRKNKSDDSPSKKMCDASTNTCDEDILDDIQMFQRSPIWPTFPSPIKSETGTSSASPDGKNFKCSQSSYMSFHNVMSSNAKPFPIYKDGKGEIVTAPVFRPSAEEFKDPLEYIRNISPQAEQYGICTIVPPSTFKPDCQLNDDMRFTLHNQHIHRLYKRWGPNVQKLAGIIKHLEGQSVTFDQAPIVATVELDLCKFYDTIQSLGGLHQVLKSNKWPKVADNLHLPLGVKLDKSNKLYDLYCKYLVSYETLPAEEKEKIDQQVASASFKKKHAKSSYCGKDAIVKMDYWNIVEDGKSHVVVHAANVDSSVYKSGFSCNARNSPYAKLLLCPVNFVIRHPWNLKVLTNNSSSILRCVGPVTGATIPTVHVGMLFTTGCWYQDPHHLPWIEYLHTGSPKIWYGIPSHHKKFEEVMKSKVPEFCQQKPIWLLSDTAMVPPSVLCDAGVSLSTITQAAGQFVVVFPEAFTATICCGYNYFRISLFCIARDLSDSSEPATFSLDKLLMGICNDSKVGIDVLKTVLPMIEALKNRELNLRKQLYDIGLKTSEHVPVLDLKSKKKKFEDEEYEECYVCQTICYISVVVNSLRNEKGNQSDIISRFGLIIVLIESNQLYYDEFNSIIEKLQSQIGSSKQKQQTASVSAKKLSKK
ncbi:Protein Jumonji [Nymphon striatum]|nr:Protein Jumonji [Nymphon striatum]